MRTTPIVKFVPRHSSATARPFTLPAPTARRLRNARARTLLWTAVAVVFAAHALAVLWTVLGR